MSEKYPYCHGVVPFFYPNVGDVYNSEPFMTFAFTYTSNLAKPMLNHVVRGPGPRPT